MPAEPNNGPIVVINPNSTEAVTAAIDVAVENLRLAGGPPIVCQTLHEGPPGVESQHDADSVIEPLCRTIAAGQFGRRLCHRLLQRPRPPFGA